MSKKTESSLSDMTNAVNQSGAFLQIYVVNELRKRGWSTDVEYSIKVSPFVDEPKNHSIIDTRLRSGSTTVDPASFVRATLESQSRVDVKETSVDVIGKKTIKGGDFFLCIESKKLDPRYVDWIFFQQEKAENIMRLVMHSHSKNGLVRLFTTTPTSKFQAETYLNVWSGKDWTPVHHESTDFALALQNKEVKAEYFKSEKTIVDQSARQIMEGTYGFIIEQMMDDAMKGEPVVSQAGNEIFIPIIVTNANLFICDFELNDIDPEKAQHTKDLKLRQVDSVLYDCSLPKTIQFPDPLSANLTKEQKKCVKKWHVLILSPKGFRDFLDANSRMAR